MKLYITKYASMTDEEFSRFAEQHRDSLTEVGRELLARFQEQLDRQEASV